MGQRHRSNLLVGDHTGSPERVERVASTAQDSKLGPIRYFAGARRFNSCHHCQLADVLSSTYLVRAQESGNENR